MQVLYIAYIIVFLIFGYAVGLQYFKRTNIGIMIIFFFLQGESL